MTKTPLRILVVDDTFTNRFLLRELIKKSGYEYMEAEDGKQGIEVMLNERPDLVLLDIEMPVMNGFETLAYIRTQMDAPLNQIPIIAITAHDPNIFKEEFQSHEFDALLTKPFSSEKIISLINQICA